MPCIRLSASYYLAYANVTTTATNKAHAIEGRLEQSGDYYGGAPTGSPRELNRLDLSPVFLIVLMSAFEPRH